MQYRISLLYIALFFALTPTLVAQAKWTNLFNGKDLKGWTQRGGKATYAVENGVLVGTAVADTPNSFMCSAEEYGDFILELEVSVDDGLNSGVQIRSQSKPDFKSGVVHGPQVEVDASDRAWSGGIYDEQRRGWVYIPDMNPEGKKAFKRKGQWNKYRIEALGGSIRTWINGIPTANVLDTLVEKGFIGLQVHSIRTKDDTGKKIRWRNVRIQSGPGLKGSPIDKCPVRNLTPNNTLTEQEKALGWKLLFNGQNLDGWRSAFKTTAPTEGWTAKDGVLSIKGSDGAESKGYGDLVSVQEFKHFELAFEFRLTEGANSGIKYFVNEKYDAKGGSAIGLEYQILDDEKHPDAKLGAAGNRKLAGLYDLIPSTFEARFRRKVDEWQYGRIVVRTDGYVEHWLNGLKVVEYPRGGNIFTALVARSKYATWENFGLAEKGPILLQDHGNLVFYRNVKVREY